MNFFVYISYHSKFIEEKRVFNEIEFYLPQLGHLMVHLEQDWAFRSLERLAIALAQTSAHIALQLTFIFSAAMEDYQPDDSKGIPNTHSDPIYFFRCAQLMRSIERAVVFGTPTLTAKEEQMLVSQLSISSLVTLKDFEKNERTNQILLADSMGGNNDGFGRLANKKIQDSTTFSGELLYKKSMRGSMFESKGWNMCYFKIDNRVLLCYPDRNSLVPLRAIPLSGCELFVVTREKYKFQFELVNKATTTKYQLRASNQEEFDSWIVKLRRYVSARS